MLFCLPKKNHRILLFCVAGLLLIAPVQRAHAQARDNTMTQAEVETLREAAYVPVDRINAYIKILDNRSKAIEDLLAKRKRPTTAQDIHDLLDQFGGIADELNDNLDTYGPKHRDVRKALPKLLLATERWSTTLRAPADDSAYNVVRKIALDAVRDLHDAATEMQTEQVAYFKEHPDAAKSEAERANPSSPEQQKPIDLPR